MRALAATSRVLKKGTGTEPRTSTRRSAKRGSEPVPFFNSETAGRRGCFCHLLSRRVG